MSKKNKWITPAIIVAVIILAIFLMGGSSPPETTEEIAKCIGENSVLYTRLGCHACENQENIFGEYYEYLNSIDCFFDQNICKEKQIEATPTWIIEGEKYKGVQSIEELQNLTGC